MKPDKPIPGRENSQSELAPGLYLTATPIGHARDLSLRALSVLANCDLIAAEDTRVTAKLLAIHGLARPMRPYNDHNAARQRPWLIARLREGARIALVSDAGTPLVSDPGFKLVREAIAEGIPIHALPGACAAIAAVSISGLPTDKFLFAGFPPAKSGERRTFLSGLRNVPAALVFYESPQRLSDSLNDMADMLGARPAAVARELTKIHEEVYRGLLGELARSFATPPRGEITVVVGPPEKPVPDYPLLDKLLDRALEFMPVRAAADLVAEAMKVSRHEAYERALNRKAGAG